MQQSTEQAPEAISHKGAEAPPSNHLGSSMMDARPSDLSQAKAQMATESTALVGQGVIPPFRINDPSADVKEQTPQSGGIMSSLENDASKYLPAMKDVAKGAYDEVVDHPGQCLEAAAKGAGIALLAVGAVAGAAALAPEIATGALIAGGALAVAGGLDAAYQLSQHAGGWSQDASVVDNAQNYSADKVAAANKDLQRVGADSALIGSGIIGSAVAAPLGALGATSAMDAVSTSAASGTVTDSLNAAIASGRYQPQIINGMTVLMPVK
jgi:hypothetical protein